MYGLSSWLDNDPYDGSEPHIQWPPPNFPYHPTHHADIQQAFELQSEIGWDEFLRGRICTDWGKIVHQYYRNMNLGAYRNQSTWETRIISTTWRIFLSTWQKRNELLHGADDTENRDIRSRDIDQQIRNAYEHRVHIAPQHRGLFTNLTETLDKPLDTKIQWLHSVRCAKTAWINHLNQDQPPADTPDNTLGDN